MAADSFPASFSSDPSVTATADGGQLAHREHIAQSARLEPELYVVADGAWCVVGNGLSNQTFVEGPDGLIVIDTGEGIEEMSAALAAVHDHTDAPIAAVIYTHNHYVGGTTALADEALAVDTLGDLPVWGHARIVANRARATATLSASVGRGVVHQFGVFLPPDGPDGLVNVGLGRFFRNPDHAPHTDGFVAPTHTFDKPTTATIAGLEVEMTPAPSDADDSITIWFPDRGVCVNNLVWPALFNVFAIRGEQYRDPLVVVDGLDHVLGLAPDHLVGAHGPPISGRDRILDEVARYRDAIQFLWDQTVRGINRGLTADELTEAVQLPDHFGATYPTQQLYGLVEHHVRQIHNGINGWFDGTESKLFPLPARERAERLIAGFGGRDEVRRQAAEALVGDDLRWALELATWLVRSEPSPVDDRRSDGGTPDERALLASVLRTIAQRTTSANVRNWCITRARELDGLLDLDRFRVHHLGSALGADDPLPYVHTLRVLLDPVAANGIDDEFAWGFPDGRRAGLHVRRCVAVPTDGTEAPLALDSDADTFARIVAGRLALGDALADARVRLTGDRSRLARVLACFDVPTLRLEAGP